LEDKSEIKEPILNQDKTENYHKSLPKDQHIHNQNYYSDIRQGENLNKIKSTGDDTRIKEHFTEGNTNFLQPRIEEKTDFNQNQNQNLIKELPKTNFNSGFTDEFKKETTIDSEKNFEKNNQNSEISVNDNSNQIKAGDGVLKGSNFNKDFNNEANLNKELHQIQSSDLPLNQLTSHTNLVNASTAEIGQRKDENIVGLGKAQAEKNIQSNQDFIQNKTITH